MDKKRMLVVDDDEGSLEVTTVMLEGLGYEVIKATSGKECLEIAKEESPDLILLDVMMPEMDGGETAQTLSENLKTKNIPIIFLTSIISEKEERVIRGYIFVAKPLNKERLLEAITKVLGV
ncbi:MAG: response regulator [Candidatus Desantisbacteria bacterium]